MNQWEQWRLRALYWLPVPRVDWPLMLMILAVCAIGLVTLYSAGGESFRYVILQSVRFGIGFSALLLFAATSPATLRRWTPSLYAATLFLLILVALFGEGRGAHRWLDLKFIRFQPSEIMKLALPMMLAWYLHRRPLPPSWKDLGICTAILIVPAGLVAEQPDLGTALLIGAAGAFVIFLSGLSWLRITAIMAIVFASLPVAWQFLHEYQRNRIRVLIDPEADPLGNGWQIIQSKIAVGSGGLFGKGLGDGTQTQLEFLPEKHTDFIFAVFSEEFGLLGVALVLLLYLILIGRCLWMAAAAGDTYSRLLAGSLAMSFFVYVIVNGGMIAGVLPVVGVPMPLISYGGTSAVSLLASFGILMSIYGHRQMLARNRDSL
jgi:rod shape determining protein RodA